MTPTDNNRDIQFKDLDIAVAHWHINAWGGAEYLITKLAEAVDVKCIYTLGSPDPQDTNPYGDIEFKDVTPALGYSSVRRLQRYAGRIFEYSQWEDIDWRGFGYPDVLITSGATTRAVITPDDALHINYCHSPPRWYYDLYHDRKDSMFGVLCRPAIRYLRMRDMTVDARVDQYIVNSPIVERRLWKYYKRDSTVLYPPIELNRYYDDGDHGFYLHLGRVDDEKGVDSVVAAFEMLDERLLMAGGTGDIDDSVLTRIERAQNIEWRGFVDEQEKIELLSQCTAVVFNGRNEDFGIIPIEANASGKAVLTRDEGFPSVFVEHGKNGYQHDGTPEGIIRAVKNFKSNGCAGLLREHSAQFDIPTFQTRLREQIKQRYIEFTHTVSSTEYG